MSRHAWRLHVGARPEGGATRFRVWAPTTRRVEVVVEGRAVPAAELTPAGDGYFEGVVDGVVAGDRYRYRLDGGDSFPDPASRWQPDGVHGPSEVVDPDDFEWSDGGWQGLDPERLVVYEMHVGTFTPEGTFAAAIDRLDHLVDLGVTAVEVMPIANFPGTRNWGYDGVNLYAPATAYGRPESFRRFVDEAHRRGIGVILDVVYNHLGPEGNYLPAITGGRFFTSRHTTPWGDAVDYDGPHSAPIRDFVLHNALYWAHEFHVDGLRLDATHAIIDDSDPHILREITRAMHALTPPRVVIAEDERNDRDLVLPAAEGGLGLDAVWADDLHHQLRRFTAGDSEGYFAAYGGTLEEVARTIRQGWFHTGQTLPDGERRGTSADGLRPAAFVHCIQNHDQVGNRALGDRLSQGISPASYRALSAILLFGPYVPLLWMGQEWAASTPFQYFTDHPDELGRLVTEGRREEFRHFSAFHDPEQREAIPDPQDPETFRRSRLRWDEAGKDAHAGVLRLYRDLIRLRLREPGLAEPVRDGFDARTAGDEALLVTRGSERAGEWLLVAAPRAAARVDLAEAGFVDSEGWRPVLWTEAERYGGAGEGSIPAAGIVELRSAGAVILSRRVSSSRP
jgi:maltooligosyltrehalose trehalohydrolase